MDFLEDQKKPTSSRKDSIWVEKYRPQSLEDYVGNESVKEAVAQFIKRQDIPHLLFFGPAGTGKTSLAKLIANAIDCDVLYLNASDYRGIDDVRDKMKSYARSEGFKSLKVLILDESDQLTPPAQGALRNMIETYSAHTRWILTCNYKDKIIEPIFSRLQSFEIKPISKRDVAIKLATILRNENVQFTTEDVQFIINTYYPDIRKIINFAQQSAIEANDGTLSLKISKENVVEVDAMVKLVELLKTPTKAGVFDEIRTLIADMDNNSLETVYRYLLDHIDEYAKGKEALIILELSESLCQSQLVITPVKDIPMLACLLRILKHLK